LHTDRDNSSTEPPPDRDFILTVAWLLAALRPRGPYPVASISGEQGSAKSTFAAMLRALVDPNAAALRALPREDRDQFIAAANGYVLAFDNLSGIPAWVSDTLCRLATGGGFATRQLHTDQDEILFDAQRPIILNGISDYVERPDLADRALLITLEPILDTKRVSERKLWREFKRARPLILSALFDAVAYGLKTLPDVTLTRSPRMADFAEWIVACEGSLWPSGTFIMAYQGSLDDAVETVLEADPVAVQVRRFMADRKSWKGSAAELLAELNGIVPEDTRRSRGSNGWPTVPHVLSGRLRRAATFLRKVRIEVHFDREGHGGPRNITLSAISEYGSKTASPASPARHQGENASQGNGLHGDARGGACADGDARSVTSVTMAIQAGDARGGTGDAHGDAPGRTSVCKKTEKDQVLRPPGDAGDAGDAVLPLFSESEKEGGPSAGDDEPPPSGSSGRCGRLRI
jgi:hypothetical protein